MSVFIHQLWRRFLLIFVTAKVAALPTTTVIHDPNRAKDVEEAGRWYFKRDILNRLEEYFETIGKMKKADPDSYDMFSRIGAVISSSKVAVFESDTLKCDGRCGFGAIFTPMTGKDADPADTDSDNIYPWFFYFHKYITPPATVQPTSGIVYQIVALWVDRKPDKKMGDMSFPGPAYLSVQPDGSVRLLKELHFSKQEIRTKKPVNQRHGYPPIISFQKAQWKTPFWLKDLSKQKKCTPEETATFLFGWAYQIYTEASKDVRVRVEKNGTVGAFMVDLLRMPYFFADRETTVAVDGKKKRIFHIVRTHKRSFRSGGHTYVKSHFRGQRWFQWNGYGITISMPGKHHADLLDATFGLIDKDAYDGPDRKMLSAKQMGKMLDASMRGKAA